MKDLLKDPGVIMMSTIIVVECFNIYRLRKTLARLNAPVELTKEEEEFIKFSDIIVGNTWYETS